MTIDRSPWIICPTCSGDGKHSRALGSFTMEEFNEAFDPDEQEAYMAGAYDQTCDTCSEAGKVRETTGLLRHAHQLANESGFNDAGERLW